MLNDPLANVMSMILNYELVGKSDCLIKPVSKVIKDILKIMKDNEYVGNFSEVEDSRGNYIKLNLIGSINKCGVVKPRYSLKNNEFEKFEMRYLPAKDVGILFISTPQGIMTHYDAKSKKIGGRLLAYCYWEKSSPTKVKIFHLPQHKCKMSMGKITKEIELPDRIEALLADNFLLIKGPEGEVKRELKQRGVSIKLEYKKILLESIRDTKENKKMIGSLAAHVKNMIKGSMQNHAYILKICSGHFPMNVSVSGSKLIVKNCLGEKVPRVLQLKEGASVKVEGDLIYVTSPSKEIAGQVAADIEQLTRRPGYDGRIFQDGIYLVNKDGKELK